MHRLRNLSIAAKLNALMAICVLGFLSLSLFSQATLSQVKIDGPLYLDIARGKDLVADILPPPEYVIEARLGVLQMLAETDPAVTNALIEKAKQLRKDFEDRHAYWSTDLPAGPMRQQLLEDSYRPGVEFFDLRDDQFIPALRRGDREEAARLANGPMKTAYETHRAAIDRLVTTANTYSDETEATARSVIHTRTFLLIALGALIGALVVAMGWWIARDITRRLARALGVLQAAADGDLSRRIEVEGGDELARISAALNDTLAAQERAVRSAHDATAEAQQAAAQVEQAAQRQRALEQEATERERREAERERQRELEHAEAARRDAERERLDAERERQRELEQAEADRRDAEQLQAKVASILAAVTAASSGDLTCEVTVRGNDAIGQMGEALAGFFANLRASIGDIAQTATDLAAASEEFSNTSGSMSVTAEKTSVQANLVSNASKNVSLNVNTVSSAASEMTASIAEIAKNVTEASRVATQAVEVAETTNQTVAKLGESSAEIGKVVKVITAIAQQTNLLALNATIEAARAGEAGKGFAVVANEVKELAKETARATEEIGGKIDAIQTDTRAAVDAIEEIGVIIGQISGLQTTIAGAVEEQTATTNEIGRNVQEAAQSASEIAENILGVAAAAQSTSDGAANGSAASRDLSRMAATLQQLVAQFRYRDDERALAA